MDRRLCSSRRVVALGALSLQYMRRLEPGVDRIVADFDFAAVGHFGGQRLELAGFDGLLYQHAAAAVGPYANRAERLLRSRAEESHAGGSDAVDFDPRFVELVVHDQLDLATRFIVLPCGLESLHIRHSCKVGQAVPDTRGWPVRHSLTC